MNLFPYERQYLYIDLFRLEDERGDVIRAAEGINSVVFDWSMQFI